MRTRSWSRAAHAAVVLGGALAAGPARAFPVAGQWLDVTRAGVPIVDPAADAGGDPWLDLVGDAASGVSAAAWSVDSAALHLRMRLDTMPPSDGGLPAATWAVLLDTDGDDASWEYAVAAWGPGTTVVLLAQDPALPEVPLVRAVLSDTEPLVGLLRLRAAATHLGDDADAFLDIAVPRTALSTALGTRGEGPFRVAFVTGASPGAATFGVDLAGDGAATLEDAWSDPIGVDSDHDGRTDAEERREGTDPLDADSDDDGLPDGDEIMAGTDPHACDSDLDLLPDGLEAGVGAPGSGTNAAAGCFRPDLDPGTTTDPLRADTDGGMLVDGIEDLDRDGVIDPWETDPRAAGDDADADGDAIPDVLERACAADAEDDADADGLPDMYEGRRDPDADGLPAFCDPDDDGDGLPTASESVFDTDGDGFIDAQDLDSDDDGVPDADEPDVDADCDTITDRVDLDSRDGPCADADGDGLDNGTEIRCGSDPHAVDSDGDGRADPEESCETDSDCDLLPDRLDADLEAAACTAPEDEPATADACAAGDGFLDCGAYTGGACSTGGTDASSVVAVLAGLLALARRGRPSAPRRGPAGGGLLVALALAAAPAEAADGFDAQRFRPVPDSDVFVGVEAARGTSDGGFARLVTNLARDPLVYRVDAQATEEPLVASLVTTELAAGWSRGRTRLSVAVPWHESRGSVLAADGGRMGDLRAAARLLLSDSRDGGPGVALSADATAPTGDAAAWLGEPSATGGVRAIATFGTRVVGTASLGGRVQRAASLRPLLDWGTRAEWSLGIAAPVHPRVRLAAEADGAWAPGGAAANGAPAEVRVGAVLRAASRLHVVTAVGTGLNRGVGSPDARGVLGVAWVPGPRAVPTPPDAPAPPPLVSVGATHLELRDKVFFDHDSDVLAPAAIVLLDAVAGALAAHPDVACVEIQGHTDDQGTDAYNLDLAGRRAEAVRRYLVTQGVATARLATRAVGEADPLQPGTSDAARGTNRRVVFRIVARSSPSPT
jgi:outer membrane protein OmpA-like peptidoglycan-associated protein